MITNKLIMYGCVVQAVMEKLLIVWTCYMLVEFLNTNCTLPCTLHCTLPSLGQLHQTAAPQLQLRPLQWNPSPDTALL